MGYQKGHYGAVWPAVNYICRFTLINLTGSPPVPGRAGRVMPVTPLQRELKRLAERVGDETMIFHSLRVFTRR